MKRGLPCFFFLFCLKGDHFRLHGRRPAPAKVRYLAYCHHWIPNERGAMEPLCHPAVTAEEAQRVADRARLLRKRFLRLVGRLEELWPDKGEAEEREHLLDSLEQMRSKSDMTHVMATMGAGRVLSFGVVEVQCPWRCAPSHKE